MRDAGRVLNLCRVKLRDQQRLAHGPLTEFPQYPNGNSAMRCRVRATRRVADSLAGSLNVRAGRRIPNAYIYFIAQAPVWEAICDVIGKPEWKTDPDYAKPPARLPRLKRSSTRSSSGP